MERPTKRFAAMLVAGVAGLAPTLAGCGQSAPTKTPGPSAGTTSTEPTATTAALPESVDYNDPKELASALAALGVESPATEPVKLDRASLEGSVFPTWPAGEVRKQGLKSYRVDVNAGFDGKGTLKFMKGSKELYSAPFDPAKPETVEAVPAVVVESLKTGDRVTWGVWFEKKSKKPVTVEFTVVEKAAATKKVADLDAARGLAPLGRLVAKAKALQNYSLLSEALVTYVDVIKADDSITSVYAEIVDCLRRMKLKNTPLYEDAKLRAVSSPSPSRKAFGADGGGNALAGVPGRTTGPKMAPIAPVAPVAKAGGSTGLKQGGSGLPPPPGSTPTAPTDPAATGEDTPADPMAGAFNAARQLAQAAADARGRADAAKRAADTAKKAADDAKATADAAAAQRDAFAAKAAENRAKAQDQTNGLTDAERKNLMDQAEALDQSAAAANEEAQAAAAVAAEQQAKADKFGHDAQRLDAQASELEKQAQGVMGVVPHPGSPTPKSGQMPDPTLPKSGPMPSVDQLRTLVQAAQTNLAAAEQRVRDAQAALDALNAAGTTGQPVTDAAAELQAAQAAQAEAGKAFDDANRALEAAQK